jgi:hypothetical protein
VEAAGWHVAHSSFAARWTRCENGWVCATTAVLSATAINVCN